MSEVPTVTIIPLTSRDPKPWRDGSGVWALRLFARDGAAWTLDPPPFIVDGDKMTIADIGDDDVMITRVTDLGGVVSTHRLVPVGEKRG